MNYQFSNCELDTDVHELSRDGLLVAVQPQVFDLLLYLLENNSRLVTREELFEKIWRGRFVSEATLSSRIKAACQAVGDNRKKQAIIQTIPRRGFRFIAEIQGKPAGDVERSQPIVPVTPVAPDGRENDPLDQPDRPSIAVLLFVSLSDDANQQFFADGMAEDITTGLSKFGHLLVIARNSTSTYKDEPIDIGAVASDLGVRYVLEGSIRRSGTRIRVVAQLIDAETGNHIWAERYDRSLDDIFEVQDEVTAAIVGAIAPEIDQAEIGRVKRKPPESLDSWGLIQKGLAFYASI